MKKLISLLLCVILTFGCFVSVGAYNFSNNGTATKKATAYRLPSVNSGDVWWVDKNDKLQVFCQDGDYYLVLYPFNNTGKHVIAYVPTSAVSTSGVPSSSNFYKSEIVRTKSNANLYHNPSTDTLTGASGSNQTVRTTVSKGQELTVLFEKDGFYCVRTSNDTGFIEKNKICTHSNTSNKNEKITVVKKDDNTHTVTTAYDEVCNDCGKTVKSNQKKTNSEKHAISNDKCTKCGYEAPVIEEKCNHSNTKENWQSSTVSQKDDTYHTVEEIYDVICADCNETLKKSQNKTYDERHSLKNDECEKCSYVVPGSEASICKHTNTAKHSSDDMKTTISIKDDNQHTIASYYHVWCTDCFTYIKENELDLVHEDHKFVNNICSVCNLEKFVEKTAYVCNTDGDNLNMRSQANSSSSIVVKIPAGASLTVTGDVINGFYPVKYNGKTGYTSTAYITFTKPAVNKTAYVYNTDGANLNMRSGANKNASIVTKMPAGSTLTVTGDATNGFYPVKYGTHSGYASTAYITFTKPSTSTTITSTNTSYVWPSSGGYLIYVLDYYYGSTRGGAHPTKGGGAIKGAIDIATTGNALATATGTIIETKYGHNSGWGNYITIKHDDGTYSFYAHLSKINVSVNQRVTAGQTIGVIGTTGNSTGVHLHFEIWDSSKKTIYTIDAFKEKYKKQLVYDGDIVTGGSNSSAIKSWVQNNYKMSGGRWYAK